MGRTNIWIISVFCFLISTFANANSNGLIVHERSNSKLINSTNSVVLSPLLPSGIDKRVFGEFLRDEVTETDNRYYRVFGQINDYCSGTLIGPRHVLTAAHCVYSLRDKKWSDDVYFTPGRHKDSRPLGVTNWKKIYVLDQYISQNNRNYDFAVIVLEEDIGNQLGWMKFGHNEGLKIVTDLSVNIVGYPGDKVLGTMWEVSCPITNIDESTQGINYICDTYGGMSGSSLFTLSPSGERYIFGIHTYGAPATNGGVFITEEINNTIQSWLNSIETLDTKTSENKKPLPDLENYTIIYENNCDKTIWTALKSKSLNGEWKTEGWWKLPAGKKATLAKTKDRTFYVYGEAEDKTHKWEGTDVLEQVRNQGDKYGFMAVNITNTDWGSYIHQFNCKE